MCVILVTAKVDLNTAFFLILIGKHFESEWMLCSNAFMEPDTLRLLHTHMN